MTIDMIDPDILVDVLGAAWVSFVDPWAELVPGCDDGVATVDHQAVVDHQAPVDHEAVVAEVWVSGQVPLLVSLNLARDSAQLVTERMLGGAVGSGVTEDDIDDAMGELANVVGGAVKSLLPDGSRLSLPSVHRTSGPEPAPGPEQGAVTACAYWGERKVVMSVRRTG